MLRRPLVHRSAALGLGFAAILLSTAPARADAIDGDWCFADGKHMQIAGPAIVTPGGKRTDGDYRRHSFSYVVPATETGAGQTVQMILLNENTVRLKLADGPMQTWHRCGPPISLLPGRLPAS